MKKKPLINRIDKNKCMNIIDIISEDEETYVFLSEIFLNKKTVIKVMKHLYNRSFVDIYDKLQNHDYFNILPFYGFTKCRDDFTQIKLKYMTEGLCSEKDYDKIYLLVMKYIEPDHDEDAYFVQGYLHAKFRLWQMDFQTRVASGRLSEIAGADKLPIDRFFRRLGMVYGAEQNMR